MEVRDFLYRQADTAEDQVAHYKRRLQESEEGETLDPYYEECVAENQAKAEAYVRLAEKLAK